MIHYEVNFLNPHAHTLQVKLTISQPNANGQKLMMPRWIPGSYMIRDFAKHVMQVKAYSRIGKNEQPVKLEKIDSSTWQAAATEGVLILEYEVYGFDRSVRGAHFDATHAFLNPCCLCLMVAGQEDKACRLTLHKPSHFNIDNWKVATTLPAKTIDALGFGEYKAKNFDELVDHPIEVGNFQRLSFDVNNIPHEIIISGSHNGDTERLVQDIQKICATHLKLFNNEAPFEKYFFLLSLVGNGYGGLEHRSSSALLASRFDMPYKGMEKPTKAYKTLLGLFSHEYFHAWNIKQIKPDVFYPYDLTCPQYTQQLWAYEGFTSYYDDLALLRAKVITEEAYYEILADNLSRFKSNLGQFKQTVTESSFDAWIKFYQPNENSPNTLVSYYQKGALAALCFDAKLRASTNDQYSLDDIMRKLWQEHGKRQKGTSESNIRDYLKALGGDKMAELVDNALDTTAELPLIAMLSELGISLTYQGCPQDNTQQALVSLGVNGVKTDQGFEISNVFSEQAAMEAGLYAKDIIIALDNFRVGNQSLEALLSRYNPGDKIDVHFFREDQLLMQPVQLGAKKENIAVVTKANDLTEVVSSRYKSWIVA